MGFVASCIETAADRSGCSIPAMLERMERVNLIDGYIYPCYETLHTLSRDNLTSDILSTLSDWEKQALT